MLSPEQIAERVEFLNAEVLGRAMARLERARAERGIIESETIN